MALTERQKEIKALLDRGQTPKQVGEALGISENAVYQQRRRIKAAGGTVKSATKTAAKATQAPRKRATRQRPARQRPALSVVTPTADPVPTDPLAAVRARQTQIGEGLLMAKQALDEAAKAHETAQKAFAEAEAKVNPELEKLNAVEALLTGKLKPPKPAPKAKAAPAPEPTPEPEQPPVAAEQDQAAEAPDEPVEVQVSANGGEERAGVPTLPEFAQEDAFAS